MERRDLLGVSSLGAAIAALSNNPQLLATPQEPPPVEGNLKVTGVRLVNTRPKRPVPPYEAAPGSWSALKGNPDSFLFRAGCDCLRLLLPGTSRRARSQLNGPGLRARLLVEENSRGEREVDSRVANRYNTPHGTPRPLRCQFSWCCDCGTLKQPTASCYPTGTSTCRRQPQGHRGSTGQHATEAARAPIRGRAWLLVRVKGKPGTASYFGLAATASACCFRGRPGVPARSLTGRVCVPGFWWKRIAGESERLTAGSRTDTTHLMERRDLLGVSSLGAAIAALSNNPQLLATPQEPPSVEGNLKVTGVRLVKTRPKRSVPPYEAAPGSWSALGAEVANPMSAYPKYKAKRSLFFPDPGGVPSFTVEIETDKASRVTGAADRVEARSSKVTSKSSC